MRGHACVPSLLSRLRVPVRSGMQCYRHVNKSRPHRGTPSSSVQCVRAFAPFIIVVALWCHIASLRRHLVRACGKSSSLSLNGRLASLSRRADVLAGEPTTGTGQKIGTRDVTHTHGHGYGYRCGSPLRYIAYSSESCPLLLSRVRVRKGRRTRIRTRTRTGTGTEL